MTIPSTSHHHSPSLTATTPRHAIVIGAGMAGLLAARILVDHFDRVTILERDRLPSHPEARPGVAQSSHAHVLLLKGQEILEQLFPGICAELVDSGASEFDWGTECLWLSPQGWMPQTTGYPISYPCSRLLLEWLVRQRVITQLPQVTCLEGYRLQGLVMDEAHKTVVGVRGLQNGAPESIIQADLVVDTSGRQSQLPKWLQEFGYAAPSETTVNSFLGYSTRWYERPRDLPADRKAMLIMAAAPHHRRGGLILPMEHDRWVVNLSSSEKDYPPTDEAGFLEFAKSLRSPLLYQAIKDAKPISSIHGYRGTENRWRHYETLDRLPGGIVALGDAVCAFNPVYAQGMTTAAISALILDRCLRQHRQNSSQHQSSHAAHLTQTFQRQLAQMLKTPWTMATSDDFRWEMTEGGQPNFMTRCMYRYMDQVMTLATRQSEVCQTFAHVIHMLQPPTALFQPSVMLGVLKQSFQRRDPSPPPISEFFIPELSDAS